MNKNILIEKFQKRLDCGAKVVRFRETILEEEEDESFKKGPYFKDKLWDEEN